MASLLRTIDDTRLLTKNASLIFSITGEKFSCYPQTTTKEHVVYSALQPKE